MRTTLSLALLGLMVAFSAPAPAEAGQFGDKLKNGAKLGAALVVLKAQCAARRLQGKKVGFAC